MNDITTSKTYKDLRFVQDSHYHILGLLADVPNGCGIVVVCHFKGENAEWFPAAASPDAEASEASGLV